MSNFLNRPLTKKQIEAITELAVQATLVPLPFQNIKNLRNDDGEYDACHFLCLTTDIAYRKVITSNALRDYLKKDEVIDTVARSLVSAFSSTNLCCSHIPGSLDIKYQAFATVITSVFQTIFALRYNTNGLDFIHCYGPAEERYDIHQALEVVQVIAGKKSIQDSLQALHEESDDPQVRWNVRRKKAKFEGLVLEHNLIFGTALTFESYKFDGIFWDALGDIIFRQACLIKENGNFSDWWITGRERFEKARRFAKEGQRSLDNYASQIVIEEMGDSINADRNIYYTFLMALALEVMGPICKRAIVIANSLSEKKEGPAAT